MKVISANLKSGTFTDKATGKSIEFNNINLYLANQKANDINDYAFGCPIEAKKIKVTDWNKCCSDSNLKDYCVMSLEDLKKLSGKDVVFFYEEAKENAKPSQLFIK